MKLTGGPLFPSHPRKKRNVETLTAQIYIKLLNKLVNYLPIYFVLSFQYPNKINRKTKGESIKLTLCSGT